MITHTCPVIINGSVPVLVLCMTWVWNYPSSGHSDVICQQLIVAIGPWTICSHHQCFTWWWNRIKAFSIHLALCAENTAQATFLHRGSETLMPWHMGDMDAILQLYFSKSVYELIYCALSEKLIIAENPVNNKSTLILVMAWCHQAPSHYLSQCWPKISVADTLSGIHLKSQSQKMSSTIHIEILKY